MANINFIVKNDIELKGNLIFEGATDNAFETTLAITDPTADNTITFPNSSGTVALTSDSPLTQTSFRNAIINGDFRVNQRGFSSLTSSGYGFDRWTWQGNAATATWSRVSFTPGNQIPGNEGTAFSRIATNALSAGDNLVSMEQRIEDVRTFAGQTVTLSFWAKATSGAPKIALTQFQSFGTGGSPSAGSTTYISQVTLSTSWTRYSVTYTIPSISGKTIGTTADTSFYSIYLMYAATSFFNSVTGSLGWQQNTFDVWGVQLEKGSVATPFEQRPIGTEISLCQRYFQKSFPIATTPTSPGGTGAGTGNNLTVFNQTLGNAYSSLIRFQTPMRRSPDVTLFNSETANAGTWSVYNSAGAANSSLAVSADSHHNGIMVQIPGVPSITVANGAWTASAEL